MHAAEVAAMAAGMDAAFDAAAAAGASNGAAIVDPRNGQVFGFRSIVATTG